MKVKKPIIRGSGGGDDGTPHVPVVQSDTLASKAYLRIVDLLCEGEIVGLVNGLNSVYLNETKILSDSGALNFTGVTIDGRTGTQNQTYVPGFASVENEVQVQTEVKHTNAIIRQITNPNVNHVRVRVSIPALTTTDNTTGDVSGSQVAFSLWIQPSGGSYTKAVSRTVTGKASSKFEVSLQADLTGTGPWNIKLQRDSLDASSGYVQNATNFESYTEIIDAKLSYPNTALVGMKIDAQQFSSIPSRYYDVKLLKIKVPSNYNPTTRTYTGIWDGTFAIAWSDNPAWVFFDLLTNDRYGLGNFIQEAQVDKWALYTIGQYCDQYVPNGFGGTEPRFTCNLLLADRAQAYAVLQNMASIFRGMIYWAAGSVTAVQDSPQDPAYLYTPANVVDGRFVYQGSASKLRKTVALVSWNDPADFYKLKVEYVEDQDAIAKFGVQESQIVAFGCTSRGQAHRLGKWLLYTEQNEGETVTFSTGLEGLVSRPGQVIKVADPSRAGVRMGGRISAATTTTVTVDQVPAGSLVGNTLSALLPTGLVEERTVTGAVGNVISVSAPFSIAPTVQGVWILKSASVEPQTYRVINVREEADGVFSVTALRHDPDKFAAVENDIVLEPKSYSILTGAPASPVNVLVSEHLYQSATEVKTKVTCSWDKVNLATGYLVRYRYDNENFVQLPETSVNEVTIFDAQPGHYYFEIFAVSSLGKISAPSTITKEIYGKTAVPADVTGFSMVPSSGMALLTWDQAQDLDVLVGGYVKIRHTPRIVGQLWKDAVDLAVVPGTSTNDTVPLLTGTYMIKFVDSSGLYSQNEKLVVTTIPDVAALNVVQTLTESPAFAGAKTGVTVDTGVHALNLGSNVNLDDEGLVDSISNWDFPFGVGSSGEYLFSSAVNLGGVWPTRIRRTLDVDGFDIANVIDARLDLMDDWLDLDGSVINDVSASLFMRTTTDNPAGTPTWSDWREISTGEYTAWGFQFKLDLYSGNESHNIHVNTLQVVLDMADRVEDFGPITSGTGVYTVNFANAFFAVPTIGITAENMASGDYYTISNVTVSSFQIQFFNSSNVGVSRAFFAIANGYGRKVA